MSKIVGCILVALTITSAIGFFVTQHRINAEAEAAFVDQLRKTDGMASKVRAYFSENIEEYVPNHQFKRMSQVPVVVARTVARQYADSQGIKFSTPSLAPRDPSNRPDSFETAALEAFARDPGLAEYYRRETYEGQPVIRYAQPVRLTQDCLQCHGEPAASKDPFGFPREGMKAGDLKGAFVFTAPVSRLLEISRANSFFIFLTSLLILLAGAGAVFFVVRRFIVKPVAAAT